jgi:hypothetical protein
MRIRITLSSCQLVLLSLLALLTILASAHAATPPTTQPQQKIPDTVLLDQINRSGKNLYKPVPFAHKKHAEMAETRTGCTTCHHHAPAPSATTQPAHVIPTQADAAIIPACRSCHPIERPADEKADIRMPTLKGAYHRQCLNCHKEWMAANACVVCHAASGPGNPALAATTPPTPDDITGRMHKPLPEPADRIYIARFTPVAGPQVLFRHNEHVKTHNIKCASCHQRDTCADCHAAEPAATTTPATQPAIILTTAPATAGPHPLRPAKTWRDSHTPCISCHEKDHCDHCHYQVGQSPPYTRKPAAPTTQPVKLAITPPPPTTRPAPEPTTRPILVRIRAKGGAS